MDINNTRLIKLGVGKHQMISYVGHKEKRSTTNAQRQKKTRTGLQSEVYHEGEA